MRNFSLEVIGGSVDGRLLSYDHVVRRTAPVYSPSIVPPLPWVSPLRGCYTLGSRRDSPFRVELARSKIAEQRGILLDTERLADASRHGPFDALATAATTESASAQLIAGETVGRMGSSGPDATAQLEGTSLTGLQIRDAGSLAPLAAGEPELKEPELNAGLARIYDALTFLGHRPWRINTEVLEVRPVLQPASCLPMERQRRACASPYLPPAVIALRSKHGFWPSYRVVKADGLFSRS